MRKALADFVDLVNTKPIVIHVPSIMIPKILVQLKKESYCIREHMFFSMMPNDKHFDSIAYMDSATWEDK